MSTLSNTNSKTGETHTGATPDENADKQHHAGNNHNHHHERDEDDDEFLEHFNDPYAHAYTRDTYITGEEADRILEEFRESIDLFLKKANYTFTREEMRRLIGSGIKNLGFLTKAYELSLVHRALRPAKFEVEEFETAIFDINFCRSMLSLIREFDRSVSNALLVYGDRAFRLALRFYASARDLAKAGDPDARAVFNMLRPYFRRRRTTDPPLTETQLERDIKALLHGRKDGEIEIEGHAAHKTAAEHAAIDDTHKPETEAFKETLHGVICSECGTNNAGHAKFCNQCGKELVISNK